MENKNPIDIVSQYYAALGERNIEMIMKLFPEHLDWQVPGNETIAPWLGQRNTYNQIREFFELLWQNTKPVSAAINHIATDGNVILSSGNFETLMLKTGKNFKSVFFTEITVVDGLIVKYILLEDTLGLMSALHQ
ncbi:nuclear transport factor 2 family protein [Chryseobacterium paridis]|uniref:Nuclear transport factor 2 family protein n=1 Tax=Chryseobacterium paridis TaxID=2800328 RepID=A0ABS1FX76_9FLAO|nr:nuclear transport factor 2 family protein [Chryseobacterium paridis]MBK1897041.1 nuclear transport factor 2 family protein [Chryseobacterium paridis]